MIVYIFGYGGNRSGGSAFKVTTMKTYSSIDPIIEQLLIEFSEDIEKYQSNFRSDSYRHDAFEAFISRWRNPPKVYYSEVDNPEFKAKRMTPKRWKTELTEFAHRRPEIMAKYLLAGSIEIESQADLFQGA